MCYHSRSTMTQKSMTTYASLLRRLLDEDWFGPAAELRVRHVLEHGTPEAIALAAHEFIRDLIRGGRLQIREGNLDIPGAQLTAADPTRRLLFTLPALALHDSGVLPVQLDPRQGLAPRFTADDFARLLERMNQGVFASVERAADLKGVVTVILDLCREFLHVPTALLLSTGLPIPGGIARGPRAPALGFPRAEPESNSAPAGDPQALPAAWGDWAQRALRHPGQALYLPDFGRIAPRCRPAARGSAIILPLHGGEGSGGAVLLGVSPEPLWFHDERLARLRLLAVHLRRVLNYSIHLQNAVACDYLTSVYNRSSFEDQLARTLAGADRKKQGFALLIIDIDDFRQFNSRYGYDAGDEVLRSIAGELGRALRATDLLARYGGEEFTVILSPDLAAAEARQIGERLRAAAQRRAVVVRDLAGKSHGVQVTVSIGGALFPRDGQNRDQLWSQANRMLLAAKAAGKNQVHFP